MLALGRAADHWSPVLAGKVATHPRGAWGQAYFSSTSHGFPSVLLSSLRVNATPDGTLPGLQDEAPIMAQNSIEMQHLTPCFL